ncbi:GNAT family N-acetyltransferase [Thiomicrospira microaerophila]|uniref:GNAT family N-acetyltransferase n=1 Tax=Thiomicrospira microaerophila TaxID=406020 RepID=UPI0005C8A732|nr:GNAT family N-acetyltransferase [Thiomicrospira microaerophila]
MVSFTEFESTDKYLLKHFTSQNKLPQPQQAERVFLAKDQQKIIGIARIVLFDNQAWLRGLYIEPTERHKGYGAQLVKYLLEKLNQNCVGFIQPDLQSFYQKLGFKKRTAEQLDAQLNEKYTQYLKTKPRLRIWCHQR